MAVSASVTMFGRQTELEQIEEIILGPAPLAFICVHGPGGIGKTTLLKAVANYLANNNDTGKNDGESVLFTDILDFDDLRLRVAQYVPYALATQLGGNNADKVFPDYLKAYARLQQMQELGRATAYQVQEQAKRTEEAFLDDYRRLAEQKRLVIMLDTVEKVQNSALWQRLVTLLLQLVNTVVVLAGRRNDEVWTDLQKQLPPPATADLLKLDDLPFGDALAYFTRTPLGQSIARDNPELSRSICELTRLPILIDLAVDWLREGVSLPELEQPWESLDEKAVDELRPNFERVLVQRILDLAKPIHQVILYMAHVYHFFDSKMLAYLTGSEEKECAELLAGMEGFSFIKPRPGGGVTLHDEMQRLIVAHVWPLVDVSGNRRRELSLKMIDYFETQLPGQQDNPILWQAVAAEQLHHHLYVDVDRGYERFDRLFQDAFDRHQTDFCSMLLEFLQPFESDLSAEKRARLEIARGGLAIKLNQIDTALDLINQGLARLQELEVEKDIDRVYNSLGYCHRLLGNWDQAIAGYEEALRYGGEERDAAQLAETMNNIANICRFNGDFERGLRYTKVSLKIREKLGDKLSIANSCYVRGMILWEIGNTAEAAAYLRRAQGLYRDLEDIVRIAWVDKYTGYFHYRIGDVDTATEYLMQAMAVFRDRSVKSDLADTLNMLSRVTRRRNVTGRAAEAVFEQAERYALEGLEIAREIGDRYKIAECSLSLFALYYRWGEEHRIHGRQEQAERYYAQAQERHAEGFTIARDGHHVDLLPMYHMYAGNMAYGLGLSAYAQGDKSSAVRKWDEAFGDYLEECRISAAYKEIRFDRALHEIASRLMRLPAPDLTQKYCNDLIYQWRKRGLEHQYPQLIAECEQVKAFLNAPEEPVVSQFSQAQIDLLSMGDWQGIVEAGQHTLEHNRVYLRNTTVVRALNASAFALRQLGRFSEARRLCTQSLHIGEVIGDRAAIAESHYVLGTIHWIVGNTAEAATHLRIARELFDELHDVTGVARVHRYEGFLYYRIGNLERALELLKGARVCFEEHKQFADLVDVLTVESRILFAAGQYEQARKNVELANEIARKIGNNYVIAETLINFYWLDFQEGRMAQKSGDQKTAANYFALSRQRLQEGAEIAHRFGYDLLISVYEKIAGDIAFDEFRLGQAFEHYVTALEHGARFEYARLHRTLDPCIDRLAQLPADQIRYYADYVTREWKARGLDIEFPDVVNAFGLIKEYREYASQA
jgi:tetratricopeptide (TPR) repeat protein